MIRKLHKNRAVNVVEYTAFIIIILGALVVFSKYFYRGFSGRLKTVGDTWGLGREWDPAKTVECIFDPVYTNQWYEQACFKGCVNTRQACITSCLTADCQR